MENDATTFNRSAGRMRLLRLVLGLLDLLQFRRDIVPHLIHLGHRPVIYVQVTRFIHVLW